MATIKCEAVAERVAYKIHPEKTGNMPKAYNQKEGLTLCERELGNCPHKNQGEEILYTESRTGIVRHCNSNGLVSKTLEEIPLTL